jgi:hypothetical protein
MANSSFSTNGNIVQGGLIILKAYEEVPDEKLTLRKLLLKRLKQLQDESTTTGTFSSIDDVLVTHNIFLTNSYKPFIATSSVYMKSMPEGAVTWGSKVRIPLWLEGDFIHDVILSVTIDPIGKPTDNPSYLEPKFKYCPMPGLRILESVDLYMNAKKLDSYTMMDAVFYYNFELPTHKREAFKASVGQETSKVAKVYNVDFELYQEYPIRNGYQTYKQYQPKMVLNIPLLFWFNKCLGKSLPILKQTNKQDQLVNQNYIEIQLADIKKIVREAMYNDDPGENSMIPNLNSSVKPQIQVELITNNIFIDNEIRAFYLKNINRYLINLHNHYNRTIGANETSIRLNELIEMGMTENLYVAVQPKSNKDSFDNWNKFCVLQDGSDTFFPTSIYINRQSPFFLDIKEARYQNEIPPISTFSLTLNTIPIIYKQSVQFYSTYYPIIHSYEKLYQPEDKGILFIPFSRVPFENGTGHISFSKFDEVIFQWKWDDEAKKSIPDEKEFILYTSARVIDFLYINDSIVDLYANVFQMYR